MAATCLIKNIEIEIQILNDLERRDPRGPIYLWVAGTDGYCFSGSPSLTCISLKFDVYDILLLLLPLPLPLPLLLLGITDVVKKHVSMGLTPSSQLQQRGQTR